jgi:hypothetical protein
MRTDQNKGQKHQPRFFDRIALRLSSGEQFDGLWIGAFDDRPEPMFHRLREALQLIKTHDPLRYARLARDLKRVWVFSIPTPACFNYRLDACQLDERFVLAETTTPELLASVIVHEATHARLWSYGIGYDEALRPRVEAICVRRQLAFVKKLPNRQQTQEQAEQALAWANPANLSNAAFSKRRDDWHIEEARRLGIPDWVVRTMVALRRPIWAVIRFTRWARRGLLAPVSR